MNGKKINIEIPKKEVDKSEVESLRKKFHIRIKDVRNKAQLKKGGD